jgi:choice-of-anchor A domain-containing protein
MNLTPVLVAAVLMAGISANGAAMATTISAAELAQDQAILSQFNLVNFGNYTANNETEGRIVAGGNFAANTNHDACFNGCTGNTATSVAGQQYGAVTVFGNVTGGFNTGSSSVQGDDYIRGSASGTFDLGHKGNFNVGGSTAGATINNALVINTAQAVLAGTQQNAGAVNTGVASAFPYGTSLDAAFKTPLTNLAAALALLPTTAGVTAQALPNPPGGNLTLTATDAYDAGGRKYGVITTTLANLAAEQNFFGINDNGNDATFVIVTGDGANFSLPNLNANNDESHVIWDFVDATTLNFSGAWYGTILAPFATIANQGGDFTGSVVANSLVQTNELHANYLFTGDLGGLAGVSDPGTPVPEPAGVAIVGVGILGLLLVRRQNARK